MQISCIPTQILEKYTLISEEKGILPVTTQRRYLSVPELTTRLFDQVRHAWLERHPLLRKKQTHKKQFRRI